MEKRLCLLVCDRIKKEVDACLALEKWGDVTVGAYAADCAGPSGVKNGPRETVARWGDDYDLIYLLGGCCIARPENPGAELPRYLVHPVDQCFYLFASKKTVDSYLNKGAYLVTPGWLNHWQQSIDTWGFDRDNAREFFTESVTCLVLLDTGVYEGNQERLQEFAGFVGVPYETVSTGLDFFRLTLARVVLEWRLEKERNELAAAYVRANKRLADYATMLDVVDGISQMKTEREAVEKILHLFTILFAPGKIVYAPVYGQQIGQIQSSQSGPVDSETVKKWLASFHQASRWAESGAGFIVRIIWQDEVLGILKIDDLALPQYKESYLNMALALNNVCGLALFQARSYEKLYRDMTESKKLDRMKDEFVSFVSHEIRTPITVIMGAVNTVLSHGQELSAEEIKGLLKDAASETEALSELVENLLEMSRAQANRLQLHIDRLNIKEVVNGQIEKVRRQCSSPAHQFTAEYPCQLPSPKADKVRVERILYNLLENAVKYSPGGGEIRVFAGAEGDNLLIGVQDHGLGMSAANQAKLFRPFERLGVVSESGIRGTGIGLTVCLRLVEAQGGRIWVESAPGRGSTFYFTLPVVNKQR